MDVDDHEYEIRRTGAAVEQKCLTGLPRTAACVTEEGRATAGGGDARIRQRRSEASGARRAEGTHDGVDGTTTTDEFEAEKTLTRSSSFSRQSASASATSQATLETWADDDASFG